MISGLEAIGGRSRRGVTVLVAVVIIAGQAISGAARPASERSAGASKVVRIEVLSNRADLISGGDALVEIVLPKGASPQRLKVKAGGRDVTSAFAVREDGRIMGLVQGLREGENRLSARLPDGRGARITITNHPIGGPVFSGPQVQPWYCNPGALDAQCNRPATYKFFYMPVVAVGSESVPVFYPVPRVFGVNPAAGVSGFLPYDPDNPPPDAAVALTTTDQSVTVPFIVRVETGTIDRGQYKIAVLYDPEKPWEPWAPQVGWNGKLFVVHGQDCKISYSEGAVVEEDLLSPYALARGFAVMFTALSHGARNCTVVTAAEAQAMVKEHLIEAHGPVRYTFGYGRSGGAIVYSQIANAYPGLYDGLVVFGSFADGWSTLQNFAADCALLLRYWNDPTVWAPGVVWTEPQEASVTGGTTIVRSCLTWAQLFAHNFTPADEGSEVPAGEQYDPQTNPEGVRATVWDYAVSILGRRPPEVWSSPERQVGRGFANRPLDNVGIQYGLHALKAGLITPAQFVDLNVKLGGYSIDHNWQPERTKADPFALTTIYRSGHYNQANNLGAVPIIDVRATETHTAHPHYMSWMMRARLDRSNGHHDNHVIWLVPDDSTTISASAQPAAFDLMDEWLTAIEADASKAPLSLKVVNNKPPGARDRCTNGTGIDVPCVMYPDESPRMRAGGPLTDDIAKCQLQPLSRTDFFPAVFTDAEWAQLQETFPTGVCDWSKPGVGQQPTIPWLTYENGPGGEPLGSPPSSVAFRAAGRR